MAILKAEQTVGEYPGNQGQRSGRTESGHTMSVLRGPVGGGGVGGGTSSAASPTFSLPLPWPLGAPLACTGEERGGALRGPDLG